MDCVPEAKKPHAICIPFPAQGHVNPMLKLAKLLHHKGFHITFVNTEYNHRRLLNSRGINSLNGSSSFQFKTIPDGLSNNSDTNSTQDLPSLCNSLGKNGSVQFRNLVNNLNNSGSGVPPVTCVVSDGSLTFTVDVAKEFGIPNALLWTINACASIGYLHFRALMEKGLVPLKDESYLTNGYLETPVDWLPGLKNVRLKDLPTMIRTIDPNDIMLNFAIQQLEGATKASATILNTFEALEGETLDAMRPLLPPLYTTGPLHLLHRLSSEKGLETIESNLWKVEPECLTWLDSKEPNSVVYVNFGSITVMTAHQLVEFAWGLSNSKHPFLWIIRPDLVVGDSAILPPEFITDTKERGLLASWCSQEEVLNHPCVGGFLTHSGWNSTIESICGGVPMICWPFFADQQINCRYSCVHWGVGMEIDNDVKRDEVEKLVRELMGGKKGKEMKLKAMAWKKKAEEASAPGGSSHINFNKLVDEVLNLTTYDNVMMT